MDGISVCVGDKLGLATADTWQLKRATAFSNELVFLQATSFSASFVLTVNIQLCVCVCVNVNKKLVSYSMLLLLNQQAVIELF